jgi:RNA polymerase sigma-70 factor (ECF subfamily)
MSTLPEQSLNNDRELVLQAARGDTGAFGELVRRYQFDVRGFLYRYLSDRNAADDVAQEVFLGAAGSIGNLENAGSARAWLLAAARFKAIDYLRKRQRQPLETNNDLEQLISHRQFERLQEATTELDHREAIDTMMDCVNELNPGPRDLVMRFYFHEESAEKIARESGRKPGGVRMALLRIRKVLARCIRHKLGEDYAP